MIKNFFYLTITLLITITFSGCTQSAFSVFETDFSLTHYKDSIISVFNQPRRYENTLQYTKKADIVSNNETKALINVTYLNPTSKQWDTKDTHNFVIGIFITTDNKDKLNSSIYNKDYVLTINQSNNFTIKQLNKNSVLIKTIPMKNMWAKYYLIKLDKSFINKNDRNKLVIDYKHKTYTDAKIEFLSQ